MLKKLFSIFKKEEKVDVEEHMSEPTIITHPPLIERLQPVEPEEEIVVITDPPEIERLLVKEEKTIGERFEVYIGNSEEDVTLVSEDMDFVNLHEAITYAHYVMARDYPEEGKVIFIHEETVDDNGQPVTNRHFC